MEKIVPHFFKEISCRAKNQIKPFNDLYFIYLIFFVFFIGGIGIWITLIQELRKNEFNYSNLVLNIGTYYLVLITTSYLDIHTNDKILNKKSLHVYSLILLIIIAGIFSMSFFLPQNYSIFISIIGLIIALFLWHIANCDNEKFMDESFMAKIKSEAKETHGSNWE